MANDLTMFEETMADLYDFLDSNGFWNSERHNYMEMNENGDCLGETVFNFLKENPKHRSYKFNVSQECAFESSLLGLVVYVISIAFTYYKNDKLIVESTFITSLGSCF